MTLIELQDKLGEQIDLITDKKTPFADRKKFADVAQTVSSLAKQMINNADVVLQGTRCAECRMCKTMADCKYYSRGECKLDGCFCFVEDPYKCEYVINDVSDTNVGNIKEVEHEAD